MLASYVMERNTHSSGEFEAAPAPLEKKMAVSGILRGAVLGALLFFVLFGLPVLILGVPRGNILVGCAVGLGLIMGAGFGSAISLRISRYTDKNRSVAPNRPNIPLRY